MGFPTYVLVFHRTYRKQMNYADFSHKLGQQTKERRAGVLRNMRDDVVKSTNKYIFITVKKEKVFGLKK